MLINDLEIKIILLSLLIDIPCIYWLLHQYITGKEGTTYWLITIISGIIIYSIWTFLENPFLEFGTNITDVFGIETYLPISKIAVSVCPGIIVVTTIKNIKNIQEDIIFFQKYSSWKDKGYKPNLIAKIIILIKENKKGL